jgi:HK97 family phage prohead protease
MNEDTLSILKKIKKDECEVRYFSPLKAGDHVINAFEVQRAGEDKPKEDEYYHIKGKACQIGNTYILYPKGYMGLSEDIYETVDEGAFDGCDMSDVVMNINHGDGNHAVARTRNGTLVLAVRDGLYIDDCRLKKVNPRCAQFYEDVKEGLLDRMSFRFHIQKEAFDESTNTFHIEKIDCVHDVSAVEFPANDDTSISDARSELLESISAERAVALSVKRSLDEADSILKGIISPGETK